VFGIDIPLPIKKMIFRLPKSPNHIPNQTMGSKYPH
jgi:hypothetical protein